ncbi:MAG: hypothetical protein H6581_04025 [Bacteroidia bacterium]|nr:hypothetical protein [Bacteroidia bacterium]
MNSFIEQLRKNNPGIFWLLAASLGFTLVGLMLDLIHKPGPADWGWNAWLMLPSRFEQTIRQPWGIFTYALITPLNGKTLIGFAFNLYFIYQFGRILQSFIGERRVRALIIFGIQFIAILAVVICTVMPGAKLGNQFIFGLSGISVALITASITLSPKYPLQLMFLGQVALIWVGLILIVLKFVSGNTLVTDPVTHGIMLNWPEMASLVSGVTVGFGYIKLAQAGYDIPLKLLVFFENIIFPRQEKPKIKVVYRKPETQQKEEEIDPNDIDRILDRINEVGYEKLTRREKEILAGLGEDEK